MGLTISENLIYVYGLVAGLVYGGTVGFMKYIFLWRKFFVNPENQTNSTGLFKRMIISYIINFIALVVVLLVKDRIPFEFMSTAIGTAIALSLSGRLFPLHKIIKNEEIKKSVEKTEAEDIE